MIAELADSRRPIMVDSCPCEVPLIQRGFIVVGLRQGKDICCHTLFVPTHRTKYRARSDACLRGGPSSWTPCSEVRCKAEHCREMATSLLAERSSPGSEQATDKPDELPTSICSSLRKLCCPREHHAMHVDAISAHNSHGSTAPYSKSTNSASPVAAWKTFLTSAPIGYRQTHRKLRQWVLRYRNDGRATSFSEPLFVDSSTDALGGIFPPPGASFQLLISIPSQRSCGTCHARSRIAL